MSQFGNVPADVLVGAVERLVSKMDENELASIYESDAATMPDGAFGPFAEAILDAFRGRGESSDDVAEGAGAALDALARRDAPAVAALLAYARANPGLLGEATTLFVERRPDLADALPERLRGAIAQRLAHAP